MNYFLKWKIPKKRTMTTVLIRKCRESFSKGDISSLFQNFLVPDKKVYADCEWFPIYSGASSILGYYYKVKTRNHEKGKNILSPYKMFNSSPYEFYYNQHKNMFAQRQIDENRPGDINKKHKSFTFEIKSEQKEINSIKEIVEEKKLNANDLPEFYSTLLPLIERFAAGTDSILLLEKIYKKPNYAQGIELYRITNSGCRKVKKISIFKNLKSIEVDCSSQNNFTGNGKFGEKVVNNCIKNRKALEKTIASLTVPSIFWKLLILCIAICIVSAGISLCYYIMYKGLFEQQGDIVKLFYYQTEQYRELSEAASIVLQAVSVNE